MNSFLSLLIFLNQYSSRKNGLQSYILFIFLTNLFLPFFFPSNPPLKADAKVNNLFIFSKFILNFFIYFSQSFSLKKECAKVNSLMLYSKFILNFFLCFLSDFSLRKRVCKSKLFVVSFQIYFELFSLFFFSLILIS